MPKQLDIGNLDDDRETLKFFQICEFARQQDFAIEIMYFRMSLQK